MKKTPRSFPRPLLVALAAAVSPLRAEDVPPGDRAPGTEIVYPDSAFLHHNPDGRVLDVTQPPFNAKGDGKTDDTAAFVRAYDYVVSRTGRGPHFKPEASFIIYVPDGVYRVTDTIVYSGEPLLWRTTGHGLDIEGVGFIRFIGQSRDGAIIRLDPRAAGFDDPEQPKPVLSYGKIDFNNCVAYNALRNLTLEVGPGNPGAVGVRFAGANHSSIENVAIRSPNGEGHTGLLVDIAPTMGCRNDLLIEGFDTGIHVEPYHTSPNLFEYVTLRNQNRAGLRMGDAIVTVRKLKSVNAVPAVAQEGSGSHLIVLESDVQYDGPFGSALPPALDHRDGCLMVRDLRTNGYPVAVRSGERVLPAGNGPVDYASHPAVVNPDHPDKRPLRLPIAELPRWEWETDLSRWASVDDFGAAGDGKTDDAAAIQRAMDSGASTIFFPKAVYRVESGVSVPPTVRHLHGAYGQLATGGGAEAAFVVDQAAEDLLVIEGFQGGNGQLVVHRADRPLLMAEASSRGVSYVNESEVPVELHIKNGNTFGKRAGVFRNGQKVWARFLNTEFKSGDNFSSVGAEVVVMGFKVEGPTVNFFASEDGKLEVLGGSTNQFGQPWPTDNPVVRIEGDAHVSVSLSLSGKRNGAQGFDTILRATDEEGDIHKVQADRFPVRPRKYRPRDSDRFVPLLIW